MTPRQRVVSLYPWFRIHPGQHEAFKALLPRFIANAAREPACLFYDFTLNGDLLHCREAYVGAEGVLAHLQNVGPLLAEAFKLADVERLELHGSAEELAKLREPLKDMPAAWFTLEAALEQPAPGA